MAFNRAFERGMPEDPGAVLPGVLSWWNTCKTMALGTGNVEEGARLKLKPVGV